MNVLWLFDTCGLVFGPAIMLAGVAAVVLCVRATARPGSRRRLRAAVGVAALPLVFGICGCVTGLVICLAERMPAVPWLALAKVCLAGAVVSLVPLVWAVFLYRARGRVEPEIATGA